MIQDTRLFNTGYLPHDSNKIRIGQDLLSQDPSNDCYSANQVPYYDEQYCISSCGYNCFIPHARCKCNCDRSKNRDPNSNIKLYPIQQTKLPLPSPSIPSTCTCAKYVIPP